MKQTSLNELSAAELVTRFTNIALEQDAAINSDDNTKYNRLYDEMDLVKAELKNRPGDQRSLLLPLLAHPNAQVRLKAAIALLAIDKEVALRALQIISDRNEYPQAADARRMIRSVSEGRYVPT